MNDMQTTLCYIEREGRTLMLHRVKKKNDMNHDKWLGVAASLSRAKVRKNVCFAK